MDDVNDVGWPRRKSTPAPNLSLAVSYCPAPGAAERGSRADFFGSRTSLVELPTVELHAWKFPWLGG